MNNKNTILGYQVEYKVIPEHKVVIASMKGTWRAAFELFTQKYIGPVTAQFSITDKWEYCKKNRLIMPNSFKAIAHCCDEDVFDAEKGKEIAYNKLADKFCNSLYKRMGVIASYFDFISNKYYADRLNHYQR